MQVTRLKLAGFKSFAEPTEVRVEPGLTGVVGPNGCGKSNIVDAIRWVMGESSARGLRGDEMEDVIFAGSDARAAFDFTEVGLVLEPQVANEGAAVEVSRRLGRGVGSTFRMNGREARARDVQRLLADSAAGARSASIVGQGQIGALVEARPHERRRLLAEAAGIAGLQSRRREAELRLDAATANLRTLAEREATLGEQGGKLQKQAREAQRWRTVNQRHREVQVLLLLARFVAAERAVAHAQSQLETAEREAAAATREAAAAASEAQATAERLQPLRRDEQRLAAERARLEERLRTRRGEADATRAAIERSRARGVELGADIERETQAAEEAAGAVTRLEAERKEAPLLKERLAEDARLADEVLEMASARLIEATAAWQEAERARSRTDEQAASALSAAAEAEALVAALERQREETAAAMGAVEARAPDAALSEPVQALEEAQAQRAAAEDARQAAAAAVEAALLARSETTTVQADARAVFDAAVTACREAADRAARRNELAARLDAVEGRRDAVILELEAATTALATIGIDELEAAASAARERLEEARGGREHAVAERARAEASRAVAADALAQARTAQARIEAERDALGERPDRAEVTPALDPARLDPSLHEAVAAALGDDALAPIDAAAAEGWRALPDRPLAPLPAGARPLAPLVDAPSVLGPRLAQTGLVDDMEAARRLQPTLAAGQRLTTPAGGLWRWDGFVRAPGVAARGTDELARELRRHALEQAAAEAGRALEGSESALDAAAARLDGATAAVLAAEEALETARQQQIDAQARLEHGRAETRRLEAARESASSDGLSLEAERAPLAERLGVIDGELAASPAIMELEARRDAAELARTEAERASAEAERALSAARARLEQADRSRAQKAERAARAEEEAARAQARRAAEEREALTELATLGERRRELEARLGEAGPARDRALVRADEAEAARAAARITAEEAAAVLETAQGARDGASAKALAASNAVETARETAEGRELELESWRERLALGREALGELRRRQETLAAEQASLADPDALAGDVEALALEVAALDAAAAAAAAERAAGEAAAETASERQRRGEAVAAATGERCEAARLRLETAAAQRTAADAAGRDRLKSAPASLLEDEEVRQEAAAADPEALEHELVRLEAQRERLGAVNLRADDELTALQGELETLASERADLERAVAELRRAIGELNREGRARILTAFKAVEGHFGQLFSRLFGGGRAELRLADDDDDPLAAGLDLGASPPGKRLQALSLLSGGEKALTAIALIFAFFRTQPAPLCVLDEVDAPLDDANVARLGDLMGEIAETTGTRFLVVTHHPLTMARMQRLYGVTMIERGLSTLVSVELEAALALRDAG